MATSRATPLWFPYSDNRAPDWANAVQHAGGGSAARPRGAHAASGSNGVDASRIGGRPLFIWNEPSPGGDAFAHAPRKLPRMELHVPRRLVRRLHRPDGPTRTRQDLLYELVHANGLA